METKCRQCKRKLEKSAFITVEKIIKLVSVVHKRIVIPKIGVSVVYGLALTTKQKDMGLDVKNTPIQRWLM